jgi:hypothetical protein
MKERVMTFPEAVTVLVAVGVAAYSERQHEGLRVAIEIAIEALDGWDDVRGGRLTREQFEILTAWAKTSPGEEGIQ